MTFNANGGTGSMSQPDRNYNAAAGPDANTFTRTGYTFGGWNTAANGSGTAYADGAELSLHGRRHPLRPVERCHSHTVTFDANGGTGTMSNQTALRRRRRP